VGKIRAGQVGARSSILARKKALVRFKDFHERLALVLDTFWFSESHVLPAIEDILTTSLLDVAVARNSRS